MKPLTCLLPAFLLSVLLVVCGSAWGDTTAVTTGDWSNPATWNNGVPNAGTPTWFNNNVTVTISTGYDATANWIRFGQAAPPGVAQLNISGGSLTMDGDTYNGVVTFLSGSGQGAGSSSVINQTGGVIHFGNANARDLSIAPDAGNVAVYNISGGSAFITRHLDIANNSVDNQNGGNGTLNITGTGAVTVGQWTKLGDIAGSVASVLVDGNGSLTTGALVVGYYNGVGSFTQNNGTVHVTAFYSSGLFGAGNVGKGDYVLNGGSFLDNADFSVNESKGSDLCTFTQNGGTFQAGTVFIGRGGPGLFTLNNGAMTVNGGLRIGSDNGAGQFIQNGGTVLANDYVSVGVASDPSLPGNATISGGTFTAQHDFSVNEGKTATCTFAQTGGTVTLNGTGIYIGRSNTGKGIYVATGGTLNVLNADWFRIASFINPNTNGELDVAGTAQVNIGGNGGGQNAGSSLVVGEGANGNSVGVVNQSGGTVTIVPTSTHGVWLGDNPGAHGTYNLNGGVLVTPKIDLTTNGAETTSTKAFNFGGGTLRANANLLVGAQPNFTSTVNAGGATFDTNGFNVTWTSPLLGGSTNAVTGASGLAGGSGYTSAPTVTVSGGGGSGATALATVVNGSVHDVVITNPGSGYNPATTTFSFSGGSPTVVASATPVITAGPGGLTKVGNGTLALGAANTYGGATTINQGTVKLVGSSLRLWLDAADSSTITSASGNVSQWRDKSGVAGGTGLGTVNQNPAFGAFPQTSVDNQNGKNVIRFTGNTGLKGAPVLAANDDSYTYFAVWKPFVTGTNDVFEQNASAVTNSQRAALLAVGGAYGFNGENNDRHDLVPYSANVWRTTSMEINNSLFDGTNNLRILDNGTQYLGRTANPDALNVGSGGISVGYKLPANAEGLNGDIAELLVYDSILNTADRTAVLNYLNYKWFGIGSPTSLPGPSLSNILPTGTSVSIASGATLDLNGVTQTIGSLAGAGNVTLGGGTLTTGNNNTTTTFSGAISGNGTLVKIGSGAQTLSGVNTYVGPTTVNAGKLLVDGSIGTGANPTAVTVNGGMLGGKGTINGAVTVAPAGTISAGDSPGHLTINGAYSLSGTMLAELGGTTQGVTYDWIDVNGAATLASGSIVDVNAWNNWPSPGEGVPYYILTATQGISPVSLAGVTFDFSGAPVGPGEWKASIVPYPAGGSNAQALMIEAVPEPATMALLGLAVAGLGGYIRRRRNIATVQSSRFDVQG